MSEIGDEALEAPEGIREDEDVEAAKVEALEV